MQEFNGELEIYSLNENVNNAVIKILKRENEPVFGLINIKEKNKKILDKMVSNIFSCKLRTYGEIETIMKDLADSWIDAYSETGDKKVLVENKWVIAFVWKKKAYSIMHEENKPLKNMTFTKQDI